MLWRENPRSVNCRYSERRRTPRYTHEHTRMVMGGIPKPHGGLFKSLCASRIWF